MRPRAHLRVRRQDIIALLRWFAALGVGATAAVTSGYRVPLSRSLPGGIYQVVHATAGPGALGLWCLPIATARWARARGYLAGGACPGGTAPVGKLVLAAAGDTVRVTPDGLVLDGCLVPNSSALRRDAAGRPLASTRAGTYVLGTDDVWLWSPHAARSYDSRYFGPVPARGLVARIRPVLTTADWAPLIVRAFRCSRRSGESVIEQYR